MSETSFKIKCSASASARRFSLSKPTLANLRSHVEASWGASGPSFWYLDVDNDRIEVMDDNDFEVACSQLRSSCVCLNVDFVSDRIEFRSEGNVDWDVSVSAGSETSQDDDGFITVELHRPVEDALPSVVAADVPITHDQFPAAAIETEDEDQRVGAADSVYHLTIVNAIEEMVASSGMGWSRDSFRAAVESSDAASLKLMIQNALLLRSSVNHVQEIAHTAIKRIENSMVKMSQAESCEQKAERRQQKRAAKFEQHLQTRPSAEQPKHVPSHAAVVHNATGFGIGACAAAYPVQNALAARDKVTSRFAGCVNHAHPLHDTSSAEYARECHRAQTMREMERAQVAATIERNLATRHSLRELKKAHIVVAPVEARAAALERTMNAKRLEKDLCRSIFVSRDSDVPVDMFVDKRDFSSMWSSLVGPHVSSEDVQRYTTCAATLSSMGFDCLNESLGRAIVAHNCDIDMILQHIFRPCS